VCVNVNSPDPLNSPSYRITWLMVLSLPVGAGAGYYSGPPAAPHDKHKAPPSESEPVDGQVNASVPGACTMYRSDPSVSSSPKNSSLPFSLQSRLRVWQEQATTPAALRNLAPAARAPLLLRKNRASSPAGERSERK